MSNAERQARYVKRHHKAGRRRWAVFVTAEERAALEVELERLRGGRAMATILARRLGVEREDLRS